MRDIGLVLDVEGRSDGISATHVSSGETKSVVHSFDVRAPGAF